MILLYHNDLTGITSTDGPLHLPHNNNPCDALAATTIPVQCVPDHRLLLFYEVFRYTGNSLAANQEQVPLR